MNDLTDVGISGALHTGIGFFGLLNALSTPLPCGWATTNSVAWTISLSGRQALDLVFCAAAAGAGASTEAFLSR